MASGQLPQTFDLQDQPSLDSKCTKRRFENQVVVVTGGCGGIGSAFVSRFVNDGAAAVAVLDLDTSRANKLIEAVGAMTTTKSAASETKSKVKFYECDISSRDSCFQTVASVISDFGKINHLVNAVAYFGSKGLTATEVDWNKTMSVNVAGISHMAQACYQEMKKISQIENCSIVNLSSISAHQAQPDRWTYAASKGAINILTKCMALDMGKDKIRVNSISPAWIWSPEVSKIDPQGRRDRCEDIASQFHILGKMGDLSEVAAAGVFLCSRDAQFITATDLKVDGGYGAMSAEGLGNKSVFAGCSD